MGIPLNTSDKARGANVRRNLRRWRKRLLPMMAGWLLLTVAVSIGATTYAHAHDFSQRRTQALGEACGVCLIIVLAAAWLSALVAADRRKAD